MMPNAAILQRGVLLARRMIDFFSDVAAKDPARTRVRERT